MQNEDPAHVLHGDYGASDTLPVALRPCAPAGGQDGGMGHKEALEEDKMLKSAGRSARIDLTL